MRTLLISIGGLALAACSHTPPQIADGQPMCNFKHLPLEVADPALKEYAQFQGEMSQVLARNTGPLLFLSGGSQHGAFGAGFVKGWSDARGGHLPEFAVVTGVSTGAIIGTWAFIGDASTPTKAYGIEDERELLTRFSKSATKEDLGFGGAVAALRHGAVADLVPFREKMGEFLTFETLGKVADEGRLPDGRRFYAAAVDLDTGQAVAFDMTDMAVKADDAHKANDTEQEKFYRDCYIDAIAASSSVPLAARPVFIDNRMYIDGGARFALFSDPGTFGNLIEGDIIAQELRGPRKAYLILNGTGTVSQICGKRDPSQCTPADPTGSLDGGHRDWDVVSLALRSVDILQNQVTRLSAAKAAADAREGANIHFARIDDVKKDNFPFTLDHPVLGTGTKTCAAWREQDRQDDPSPFEFQPRYMHCLIAYGESEAKEKIASGEWP